MIEKRIERTRVTSYLMLLTLYVYPLDMDSDIYLPLTKMNLLMDIKQCINWVCVGYVSPETVSLSLSLPDKASVSRGGFLIWITRAWTEATIVHTQRYSYSVPSIR